MKYEHDELFSKLFKQDVFIPEETLMALNNACESLDSDDVCSYEKRHRKLGRRSLFVLIAAILVMALFAGSVLAYSLINPQFYNSIFGTGISGNENDRTYLTADGHEAHFPLNERVDVDAADAEAVVGKYVQIINQNVILDDITITVNEFIIDVNGIGYITYTVYCPTGFENIIDVYYLDFVSTSFMSSYFINGEVHSVNDRALMNTEASSSNRAYIIQPFTIPSKIDSDTDFSIGFYDRESNYETCQRISLPLDTMVPAKTYLSSSKEHIISLSPLGMMVECSGHNCDDCSITDIRLLSPESEYVVIGENIGNKIMSTLWDVSVAYDMPEPEKCGRTSYLFNRLVVPENVSEIILDGTSYFPA